MAMSDWARKKNMPGKMALREGVNLRERRRLCKCVRVFDHLCKFSPPAYLTPSQSIVS